VNDERAEHQVKCSHLAFPHLKLTIKEFLNLPQKVTLWKHT